MRYWFWLLSLKMYVVVIMNMKVRGYEIMKTEIWKIKKYPNALKNFLMFLFLYKQTPHMQDSNRHPQQLNGSGFFITFLFLIAISTKFSHIRSKVSLRLYPVLKLTSI